MMRFVRSGIASVDIQYRQLVGRLLENLTTPTYASPKTLLTTNIDHIIRDQPLFIWNGWGDDLD